MNPMRGPGTRSTKQAETKFVTALLAAEKQPGFVRRGFGNPATIGKPHEGVRK